VDDVGGCAEKGGGGKNVLLFKGGFGGFPSGGKKGRVVGRALMPKRRSRRGEG